MAFRDKRDGFWSKIRLFLVGVKDWLWGHPKALLPLAVMVAAALVFALVFRWVKASKQGESLAETAQAANVAQESQPLTVPGVALAANEDGELYTLIATYYNALATGDIQTLKTISNFVSETEEIRMAQMQHYIELYPELEIFTKPGPEADSHLVYVYSKVKFYGFEEHVPGLQAFYVCKNDQGAYYLNEGDVSQEVLDYIVSVNLQEDVVELNNKVNVECNEIYLANPKLFAFIQELEVAVGRATGEALAAKAAGETTAAETPAVETPAPETASADPAAADPAAAQPLTAKTTTTVNMRVSDSELADRLGKVPGGSQVQVLEHQANGWSKVIYDGKEGYIKSEYLADASQAGQAIEGGAEATTNVNIRSTPSESGEKLGTLVGGATAEVLGTEGLWTKIRYNGIEGYVKTEFLR